MCCTSKCAEDSPPHVRRIVTLKDFFPAIVQGAIAEQKTQPAQREILAMLGRKSIEHEGRANFVVFAMPALARKIGAKGGGASYFGISERFVMPVVQAHAQKGAQRRRHSCSTFSPTPFLVRPGCRVAMMSGVVSGPLEIC